MYRYSLLFASLVAAVMFSGYSRIYGADFAGGSGTPNDPYQITTREHLLSINSDAELLDAFFVLEADIDLNPSLPGGSVFSRAVILVSESARSGFSGSFNGNSHKISNLVIDNSALQNPAGTVGAGLFERIELKGRIRNLNIDNAEVSSRGESFCGSLAGVNYGAVWHCTSTGTVEGETAYAGGLIGLSSEGGLVAHCSSIADVTGRVAGGLIGASFHGLIVHCSSTSDVAGVTAGGIVGMTDSVVKCCHATGNVQGDHTAGGLVGEAIPPAPLIISCHTDGHVTSEGDILAAAGGLVGRTSAGKIVTSYSTSHVIGQYAGGLVGDSRIPYLVLFNCYASGDVTSLPFEGSMFGSSGGLVGFSGTATGATSCFWNTEVSGMDLGLGHPEHFPVPPQPQDATGLHTGEMQKAETFIRKGWDFESTWTICENDYPRLAWEQISCRDPNVLAGDL